jgi:hypothetical protein
VRDAAGHIVQKDGAPFHDSSQFDGDGLMIYNQYTSPYTTPFVSRTYYLRSTALRGLAVAELNVSGRKEMCMPVTETLPRRWAAR